MPSPGTEKLREGPLPALLPAELGGPPPLPGAEVSPDPGDGEAGGQLPPHRCPAARRRVQPQQPRVEILLHLHTPQPSLETSPMKNKMKQKYFYEIGKIYLYNLI